MPECISAFGRALQNTGVVAHVRAAKRWDDASHCSVATIVARLIGLPLSVWMTKTFVTFGSLSAFVGI